MRISRDQMFMEIAHVVAKRGTCPRAKVGAVLVNRFNNIVSIGYNGSQPGRDHCEDVGCMIHDNHCIRSAHAERNAIDRGVDQSFRFLPLTLYVTHMPCAECMEEIKKQVFSIRRVVYDIPYRYEGPENWVETVEGHRYKGVLRVERYSIPAGRE